MLGSPQRGITAADQTKIGSISDFIIVRLSWTTELSSVESQGSLKCKRVTQGSQRGLQLWKSSEWWSTAGFEDREVDLGTWATATGKGKGVNSPLGFPERDGALQNS